ncbi:MAG: hypothetical protein IJQ25_05820 [Oscillibacter sp.]|nr:hypothetical protein [Oscillibacter sp.]
MGNLKMRPLWTLAGAYLLYLAYQQARLLLQGGAYTRGEGVLFAVSAVLFAAVGAWVLWREWKYAHAPDDSEEVADTAEDSAEFADDSGENLDTLDDSGEVADDSGETGDGL